MVIVGQQVFVKDDVGGFEVLRDFVAAAVGSDVHGDLVAAGEAFVFAVDFDAVLLEVLPGRLRRSSRFGCEVFAKQLHFQGGYAQSWEPAKVGAGGAEGENGVLDFFDGFLHVYAFRVAHDDAALGTRERFVGTGGDEVCAFPQGVLELAARISPRTCEARRRRCAHLYRPLKSLIGEGQKEAAPKVTMPASRADDIGGAVRVNVHLINVVNVVDVLDTQHGAS